MIQSLVVVITQAIISASVLGMPLDVIESEIVLVKRPKSEEVQTSVLEISNIKLNNSQRKQLFCFCLSLVNHRYVK